MKKIIILFICALVCVNSLFAQFADVIIGKWEKVMDLVGSQGGVLAESDNSESLLFSPMMFTNVRIDPDGTIYNEGMQLTEVISNEANNIWTVLLCTNADMQTLPPSHNARFTAWYNQLPSELNVWNNATMNTVKSKIAGKDYMVIILHSTSDDPNEPIETGFSSVSGGGQSTLDSNPNYKPRAKSMMLILVR